VNSGNSCRCLLLVRCSKASAVRTVDTRPARWFHARRSAPRARNLPLWANISRWLRSMVPLSVSFLAHYSDIELEQQSSSRKLPAVTCIPPCLPFSNDGSYREAFTAEVRKVRLNPPQIPLPPQQVPGSPQNRQPIHPIGLDTCAKPFDLRMVDRNWRNTDQVGVGPGNTLSTWRCILPMKYQIRSFSHP